MNTEEYLAECVCLWKVMLLLWKFSGCKNDEVSESIPSLKLSATSLNDFF